MQNYEYFNDSPIQRPEEDIFGINSFAKALADSIMKLDSPVGTTLAINGAWGSGKSSAINLILYHLKDAINSGSIILVNFKCWWFRGEEALTLAFLQELNSALPRDLGEKAKEAIPRIGKFLLQAGPVLGPAVNLMTGGLGGSLAEGSIDYIKSLFSDYDSVEHIFEQLYEALEKRNKRFLVIIDDIDRLAPDEAILIFRLIKSVGRLPNIIYLLAFDRIIAEKIVEEKYPSEGPHFLEKIIQSNLDLPIPTRYDINQATWSVIEEQCDPLKIDEESDRFISLFYDIISPYICTPRDIIRLSNSIMITWPMVAGEVDVGDYTSLEVIRLFEPQLYNAIRLNKEIVCGVSSGLIDKKDPEADIQKIMVNVAESRRELARRALTSLFPHLQHVSYSHDSKLEWEKQRRVCTENYFDTYFRMALSSDNVPRSAIEELINRAGDKEYVKIKFITAKESTRTNQQSMVPVLFDELMAHADEINLEHFKSLITALFEIADDIYLYIDESKGYHIGNNYLRIHWLIRQTLLRRCSLDKRSEILFNACRTAQIGWLADFTYSASDDHFPRGDRKPEPPEECLVSRDYLPKIKSQFIQCINYAVGDKSLIDHFKLLSLLVRWEEFSDDDGQAVREWTRAHISTDEGVSKLARACTSETLSYSSDRSLPRRRPRAAIEGLDSILDVVEFRRRLEEVESDESLEDSIRQPVQVFLEAWRKEERGERD